MSSDNIPIIVITGGPCGGKTTLMSFLRQKLSDLGYYVLVVSETATELISAGVSPVALGGMSFQKLLFPLQISKEMICMMGAKQLIAKGLKPVILCDRGLADSAAYVSDRDFELLLREMGHSFVEIRDKRYDAVIHLVSVAVDKPVYYTTENNPARKESVAEAAALDLKTRNAWTGSPHLSIIGNETDLDGKVDEAFGAICRILGIPEPIEIERKYLVKDFDLSNLPEHTQPIDIVQHYLVIGKTRVERIRRRGQYGSYVYYHTVKSSVSSMVRSEYERQITENEYYEYLNLVDPAYKEIKKTRRCFVHENQYFELDSFRNLSGLTLLEIELTKVSTGVIIPPYLEGKLTEVTEDFRFANSELAKNGYVP